MKKILITPSSFGQISEEPLDILKSAGFQVVKNPYGRKLTKSETVSLCQGCVGVVAGLETYDKEVLDQLSDLKIISRVGVGMDSIDQDYCERIGVKVLNTPNGPTRAVAELALSLAMASLRKVGQAHHNLKSGHWKKETGYLIQNKTIGILGVGRIGKASAELFAALGNEVLGFDLFPDHEWSNKSGLRYVTFEELLSESDILILHLSNSNPERPVIGNRELGLMKDESFLVNLSRGGVLDELALESYLDEGKFGGVALDVFSEEPYSGSLIGQDKIIFTPHLGSYAKEGKLQMEIDSCLNLIEASEVN